MPQTKAFDSKTFYDAINHALNARDQMRGRGNSGTMTVRGLPFVDPSSGGFGGKKGGFIGQAFDLATKHAERDHEKWLLRREDRMKSREGGSTTFAGGPSSMGAHPMDEGHPDKVAQAQRMNAQNSGLGGRLESGRISAGSSGFSNPLAPKEGGGGGAPGDTGGLTPGPTEKLSGVSPTSSNNAPLKEGKWSPSRTFSSKWGPTVPILGGGGGGGSDGGGGRLTLRGSGTPENPISITQASDPNRRRRRSSDDAD